MPTPTYRMVPEPSMQLMDPGFNFGFFPSLNSAAILAPSMRTLPPGGGGYIAGEAPNGLVTYNSAPAVRALDLFDRATDLLVASTTSASDGTYAFNFLDTTRLYDVRARGSSSSENDLIMAQITPVLRTFALTGTLANMVPGRAYSSYLTVSGGNLGYRNLRITSGTLPTGLSLQLVWDTSGLTAKLYVQGTPAQTTAYGATSFTIGVDDSLGSTVTSAQTPTVVAGDAWYVPIFGGSDVGMVFDFNDLSTLFQDTSHTVPVTTVGQTISAVQCKKTGVYAIVQSGASATLDLDSATNKYRAKLGATTTGNTPVFQAAGTLPSAFSGDKALSIIEVAEFATAENAIPVFLGTVSPSNGNAIALGNNTDPSNVFDFLMFGAGNGVQSTALNGVHVAVGTKAARSGTNAMVAYVDGASRMLVGATGTTPNITTLNFDIGRITNANRTIYSVGVINRVLSPTEVATVSSYALTG